MLSNRTVSAVVIGPIEDLNMSGYLLESLVGVNATLVSETEGNFPKEYDMSVTWPFASLLYLTPVITRDVPCVNGTEPVDWVKLPLTYVAFVAVPVGV